LKRELAEHRAAALAQSASAQTHNGRDVNVILRAIDADADELKALAARVTSSPGFVAVLLSTSRPARAVVARSADLPISANEVLAALTSRFGGRGGGRPEFAQGGGLDGPPVEILAAAAEHLGFSKPEA